MPMPLISVIIPAKNAEAYIGEAIASILHQEHDAMDILVVDGGSSDATRERAAAFPKVTLLSEPEPGSTAALNRGIAEARGAYLAFLDADDLWPPGRIAGQLSVLEADPGVDLCFGHMESFYSSDMPSHERAMRECPPGSHPAILAGAMLARRERFMAVGPFNGEYRYTAFIEWYGRAKEHRLTHRMLRDTVLRRRIHGGNVSIVRREETQREYLRLTLAMAKRRRAMEAQ